MGCIFSKQPALTIEEYTVSPKERPAQITSGRRSNAYVQKLESVQASNGVGEGKEVTKTRSKHNADLAVDVAEPGAKVLMVGVGALDASFSKPSHLRASKMLFLRCGSLRQRSSGGWEGIAELTGMETMVYLGLVCAREVGSKSLAPLSKRPSKVGVSTRLS